MSKLRLLVLSVGTQVGQNILTTLAGRRDGVELIATSTVSHEPAVFDYDVVYLAPPTAAEPEAFERCVLDIIDREHVDLVIPCRDDDVVFLASLRDRRLDLAQKLLCGSAAAARVIGDKWLSAEFCVRRGLPFAPSIIDGTPQNRGTFVRKHGFPLVAKPRRGYASQDVYLLSNDAQFEHALAHDGWVVQKFLGDPRVIADYLGGIEARGVPLYHTFQGLKRSIQALIAPDGSVVHVICTRNMSRQRRSKWVEPDRDPLSLELGTACANAFSAAGWRGPLNIQCQKDGDGTLLIHEFNGRFTGATVDRWLLGYDEVGAAVESFTGQRIYSDRPRATASLEAFESLVARGADPRLVESLASERVWRRAR
jgi:carbamoyl-phosphate synthase large subunit